MSGNGFQPLGLSDPVFRGVVRMGFRQPTPVQRKALPVILSGSDVIVMSRTGSGKTCAFLIPILEKLLEPNSSAQQSKKCRAVVLSPTRELSLQTLRVMNKLSHFAEIKSIGINGGEGMEKQFNALASKPDVIIATPGRLAHHLSEIPDFDLKGCQICVLDEADRLLEMGFAAQIRQIATTLPEYCQKVLLSATMPKILVEFTKSGFTTDPQVVRLDQEANVSAELRIAFITCRSADKDAVLLHVLEHIERDKQENKASRTGLTLIFAATRHHVEYISTLLAASGVENTVIYGTLDQDARKSNLATFRSGTKPVLVVTDVAARGIDVPLIDHVIHYAFPPNPKLFVHRSGRAARAGRVGYCWGLVEPDEMPYMIDLHLFLGRKLSTGMEDKTDDEEATYTLNEMTPDQVHYGSVPEAVLSREIENVRRIMESELTGSNQAETLRSLSKVCANAIKQYRKTRPEASKEGVRRAKAILEGERLETGQRVGGGLIRPHPLLWGMDRRDFLKRKSRGEIDNLCDIENQKKREEFLKQMSNFRPKETVFEAFATGGGKEIGVLSQIDKGRTTGAKKHDVSAALSAMKSMRRQMRIAHVKGASLVVAGSQVEEIEPDDVSKLGEADVAKASISAVVSDMKKLEGKRRVSAAARKRLKKGEASASLPSAASQEKKTKEKKGADFRDEAFFIENDFLSSSGEAARARQIEASMQPSASGSIKGSIGTALRLEEAMIDIVGDERADLAQKQRMMRWDKSKRKYVQTTVGAELSGESKSKKMRLESGQLVKSDKMKLGELYEKWQKKTNRSIGRSGVFDDVVGEEALPSSLRVGKSAGGKSVMQEKPKTVSQIRKEREAKQNMKLKNTKKADRRKIEQRQRQAKNASKAKAANKTKKGTKGKGRR
jgi:ATP-dependent RNA helicase DDX54/DBP10